MFVAVIEVLRVASGKERYTKSRFANAIHPSKPIMIERAIQRD
jgi:hypothetical protein